MFANHHLSQAGKTELEMQNKLESLFKFSIVAVIASLPIAVPAQAGDMHFGSGFMTDGNPPNALPADPGWLVDEPGLGAKGAEFSSFTNLISYGISGARASGTKADANADSPDANTAAFLAETRSALVDFSGPGTAVDAIDSMLTGHADVGGLALGGDAGRFDLGVIQMFGPGTSGIVSHGNSGSSTVVGELDSLPNLSAAYDDRPLVIKWIHTLLEAVGMRTQCIDPAVQDVVECEDRIAAR